MLRRRKFCWQGRQTFESDFISDQLKPFVGNVRITNRVSTLVAMSDKEQWRLAVWHCERSKVLFLVFVSPVILKLASIRGKMKCAVITLAFAMTVSGSSIWTHSNPVSYDDYSILEVSFGKSVVDSCWTHLTPKQRFFMKDFILAQNFFTYLRFCNQLVNKALCNTKI